MREMPAKDGGGGVMYIRPTLSNRLEDAVQGRVCVLGIGNRERGDDGAGSLLAECLAGRLTATVIDAGDVPENYLEQVAHDDPDTVLMLDAADFGGAPGEIRMLDPAVIRSSGPSTHTLPLSMAADYLERRTRAHMVVLGIQPETVELGAELSEAVALAIDVATALLEAQFAVDRLDLCQVGDSCMPGQDGAGQ